ncbi:MAG: type II toxin-antitoxin system VapC family toxin [Thermodesulfobacteriota bacterium]
MRYLLDTNVLSEPTRRMPDAGVMAHLALHDSESCTAAPVIHEMVFGIERMDPGRRREQLSEYVARVLRVPIPVLPYDEAAARWHARERARLEKTGQPPAFVDGQIAAIAAVHGLVLVTRNVRQFEVFADLPLVNWFQDAHAKPA